jgi:hypothetical protein
VHQLRPLTTRNGPATLIKGNGAAPPRRVYSMPCHTTGDSRVHGDRKANHYGFSWPSVPEPAVRSCRLDRFRDDIRGGEVCRLCLRKGTEAPFAIQLDEDILRVINVDDRSE